MFQSPVSQASAVIMVLVCGYALICGRWPERATAIAQAINWLGSTALQDRRLHHHSQPLMFLIDCAFFAFIGGVYAKTGKRWLCFALLFQLMIIMTHVVNLVEGSFGQWVFFSAYLIWSWCVLASLAWGAYFAAKTRSRAAALRRPDKFGAVQSAARRKSATP